MLNLNLDQALFSPRFQLQEPILNVFRLKLPLIYLQRMHRRILFGSQMHSNNSDKENRLSFLNSLTTNEVFLLLFRPNTSNMHSEYDFIAQTVHPLRRFISY